MSSSDPPHDDSADRVRAALGVLRRGSRAGSAGSVAYIVYVIAIFAIVYGFPYGRTIFAALGGDRVTSLAQEPAVLVSAALGYVGMLVLARRGGRLSGPVAPPPVWTHHVVTASIDRVVALRRWWWLALGGVVGTGVVLGGVLGLSLWSAGVTGPVGALVATIVGAAASAVVARVWLGAQAAAEPPLGEGRPLTSSALLRCLGVEGLLAQAERRFFLSAGALAGNIDTVREQLGSGRPPARRGALRPGAAMILRRDLLALRRGGPGWVGGLGVVAVGAWLAATALLSGLPALMLVGVLVLHVGVSAWTRPLRLLASRSGVPPLLGWSAEQQAARHVVLPGLLATISSLVGCALAAAGHPQPIAWLPLAVVPLVLGVATWSAFRSPPGLTTVMPQSLVPTLVIWWLMPALLVLAVTGGALAWADGTAAAATPILLVGLAVLAWSILRPGR